MKNQYTYQYFSFPPASIKDQLIHNLKHLKELISNFQNTDSDYTKFKFTSSLYPRQQITMQCQQCPAQIVYKIGEKSLKLINFKNEHCHIKIKKKGNQLNQKQESSKPLLENENLEDSKLKNNQVKFFNQASKSKDANYIKNIIKDLENKQYMVNTIYSEDNEEQPYLVLLISQQMRQNYHKFGDIVCFSIINHLLKDRYYNNIGLFTGVDTGARLTLFGFCFIMNKQNDKIYEQLFRSFFQKMQRSPQSFFTDQRSSIRMGLEKIQEQGIYPGLHLYDSFQILSKIKKKINDPQKLKLFKKIIEAQTIQQFNSNVQNLKSNSSSQQIQILNNFLKKAKLFCFSKIPQVFVGLSVAQSITKKVSELVRNHIPQGSLKDVLKAIQSQEKSQKPVFHNKNIEDFFSSNILKFYRENLEQKIYKIAVYLYFQKANFRILSDDPEQNVIVVVESKSSPNYSNEKKPIQYIVREQIQKYYCSCGLTIKIGIPCPHLIKVLQYKRLSIQSYLNPRWIVINQDSQKNRKAKQARKNGDLISVGSSDIDCDQQLMQQEKKNEIINEIMDEKMQNPDVLITQIENKERIQQNKNLELINIIQNIQNINNVSDLIDNATNKSINKQCQMEIQQSNIVQKQITHIQKVLNNQSNPINLEQTNTDNILKDIIIQGNINEAMNLNNQCSKENQPVAQGNQTRVQGNQTRVQNQNRNEVKNHSDPIIINQSQQQQLNYEIQQVMEIKNENKAKCYLEVTKQTVEKDTQLEVEVLEGPQTKKQIADDKQSQFTVRRLD